MNHFKHCGGGTLARRLQALMALATLAFALLPGSAQAIPAFNRQTGQNCVACHAGGQFPELTPYGRLFKVTGYTIGQRTVPISAMVLGSLSKVADTSKSADPAAEFQKEGKAIMATASLLLGGKLTDNIGAFAPAEDELHARAARRFHEFDVGIARIAEHMADARRFQILHHHFGYVHRIIPPFRNTVACVSATGMVFCVQKFHPLAGDVRVDLGC